MKMHVHAHTHTYTHACPSACTYIHTYIHAHAHTHMCTYILLLEIASDTKKCIPRHTIPRGYSLDYPPLLQECKKRSGKNLGRGNRWCTAKGH